MPSVLQGMLCRFGSCLFGLLCLCQGLSTFFFQTFHLSNGAVVPCHEKQRRLPVPTWAASWTAEAWRIDSWSCKYCTCTSQANQPPQKKILNPEKTMFPPIFWGDTILFHWSPKICHVAPLKVGLVGTLESSSWRFKARMAAWKIFPMPTSSAFSLIFSQSWIKMAQKKTRRTNHEK